MGILKILYTWMLITSKVMLPPSEKLDLTFPMNIINGIDFDEKLEELRTNLHAAICYRFNGYMPLIYHLTHFRNTSAFHPGPFSYNTSGATWIKFEDIDPDINAIVRKHFWEML